jgi:hypothetical protein
MNAWLQQIHAWHEFYLLVGTSVAALTGLMFVVVSIGPEVIIGRPMGGVRAFVTPTVVYFTTVLVVSAVMMMPHVGPVVLGVMLLLGGLAGLAYIVWIGTYKQWRESELQWDDLAWYVALPVLAYVLMLAAGIGMWLRSAFGAFTLGAATILLMVVGIRNAWDLVLWFAQKRGAPESKE